MNTRPRLIAIAWLTATAVYIGLWAAAFPRSFYDTFPGFHRMWVGGDGPFNEHLARDTGSLYLALAVIGVLALIWRDRRTSLVVGAAWTTFSLPHLAYHLGHLDEFGLLDKVGNVVTLGGTLLVALFLLLPRRPRSSGSKSVRAYQVPGSVPAP